MKILPAGAEFFNANSRTYGQTNMTKVIVVFSSFANSPKKKETNFQPERTGKSDRCFQTIFNYTSLSELVWCQQRLPFPWTKCSFSFPTIWINILLWKINFFCHNIGKTRQRNCLLQELYFISAFSTVPPRIEKLTSLKRAHIFH